MSSQPVPPAPILLARGGLNDLDAVMAIMASAFAARYGEGWSKSQCAGILPLSGVTLTLARDGHGVARGFALERAVADEAELLLLAVDEPAQGMGYGGELLRDFIRSGKATGRALLHLEVRDGNPAVAIYERYGFRPIGRRKDYYRGLDGMRHDAVTMALDLA
jgi:ribosomal-protein-alanine N-acetyltransferase